MTLVEFLLARIAEDEGMARLAQQVASGPMVPAVESRAVVFDAPRVLAECEAKRRIVELAWHHLGEDDYAWGMEEAKRQVLAVMAAIYADHPDYDESWRP